MDTPQCEKEMPASSALINLNQVKVYIINLEESRTRWIQCYRRMSRFFQPSQICRVPAVDGRLFACEGRPKEWNPAHRKRLVQEGILSTQVTPDPIRTALCMSHQRALKMFLDESPLGEDGDCWALILEDDARPSELLVNANCSELALNPPKDADLLFLHDRVTGDLVKTTDSEASGSSLPAIWQTVTGGIGLEAYLINPRGARRVLDAWNPLHYECDLQLMAFMKASKFRSRIAKDVCSLRKKAGRTMPVINAYSPTRPLMQVDETIPSVKMDLLRGLPAEPTHSSSVERLQFDKSVPIAFATCWFNPRHYRARLDNFMHFYHRSKIPNLVVVELAFGDEDWQLPDDLPNLIRLRTETLCWQKEALLNHAFHLLDRAGFPYLGWLDADLVFRTEDWVQKVLDALHDKKLVQVFETVRLAFPDRGMECLAGAAAGWVSGGVHPCKTGVTGFGWAMHSRVWREALLYDHGLLGGGDSVMWRACFHGRLDTQSLYGIRALPLSLHQMRDEWAATWSTEVDMQIGYANGVEIEALPHGKAVDRKYMSRSEVLGDHGYVAELHMERDAAGLLHWTKFAPPALRMAVESYFSARREDHLG